jgi:hypothetical protein
MPDQTPNSRAAAVPEFLLDDSDHLTAEEEAALEAEITEPTEPEPEPLPAKRTPEAPAPEQQQATPPKEPAKKAPPKAIPYERFKEAIEKGNALAEQLAAERETKARLDERLKMIRESEERAAAEKAKQPPAEVPSKLGARPDPTIDPIGADLYDVRRENEILAHRLEQNQAAVGQNSQQMQADRDRQEFSNWINNDVAQFRAQHPDYEQATAHVFQFRVNYWKRLGLGDEQAQAIVNQEAFASASLARANKRSAAEGFYELAKEVGYQPNGNGAGSPPAKTPEVLPSPTQAAKDRLNQVRKGQAFQGLSRVPAEKSENLDWSSMTAQELADYPEDQLAEDLNDPVKGPMLRKVYARLELGQ